MTYYTVLNSPIGRLLLTSDSANITGLYMEEHEGGPTAMAGFENLSEDAMPRFSTLPLGSWESGETIPILGEALSQLESYFSGRLKQFKLPLKPEGTEFQKKVWEELTRIPFGQTASYGELARRVGNPDAPRAVGLANGKNPISIIVPCHRVIGASGMLTGYGGGLDRKKWLLEHEGVSIGGKQPELALN